MSIIIDTGGSTPLDYPGLKAKVALWMARTDSTFTGSVADFIQLGEERIWRDLRVDKMLLPLGLTILAGQNAAALPSDWLAFRTIKAPAYGRPIGIEYMPPEDIDNLPECGNPTAYSIIGQMLVYGTTVANDTNITGFYYARPPSLETNSTNWLIAEAPSVYLYSALLEGAIFLKNSKSAGEYGTLYDKAIATIQTNDRAAMSSGSRLRIRAR